MSRKKHSFFKVVRHSVHYLIQSLCKAWSPISGHRPKTLFLIPVLILRCILGRYIVWQNFDHHHWWRWKFWDVGKAAAPLAAPTVSPLTPYDLKPHHLSQKFNSQKWIVPPIFFSDRPGRRRHRQMGRLQMRELCTSDCFHQGLSTSVRLHSLRNTCHIHKNSYVWGK